MVSLTLSDLSGAADPGDPADPAWAGVPAVTVPLAPVPVDAQPNAYIRASWADRPYGRTPTADVAAATVGDRLLLRLSWEGSGEAPGEFPDACGALFPGGQGPALPATMGSAEEPVTLWQWRDRTEAQQQAQPAARHLVARGPGVFRPAAGGGELSAAALRTGGRWAVVLSGPRDVLGDDARVAVAVWDGPSDERAGIGAVSAEWAAVVR